MSIRACIVKRTMFSSNFSQFQWFFNEKIGEEARFFMFSTEFLLELAYICLCKEKRRKMQRAETWWWSYVWDLHWAFFALENFCDKYFDITEFQYDVQDCKLNFNSVPKKEWFEIILHILLGLKILKITLVTFPIVMLVSEFF